MIDDSIRVLGGREPHRFDMADQLAFAALSGDHNPMHVDAIVARRLIHGRPIVHGIHLLLWALDGWLADSDGPIALREVMLVLKSPVGIDEPVARSEARRIEDGVELEVRVEDSECALIRVKWAGPGHYAETVVADEFPACTNPEPSIVDKIRAATGGLDLCLARESCRGLFPNVMKRLPASQTAVLLATTRLVGMSCPGLDSLYSELQMAFWSEARQPSELRYAVKSYHDRLGLVAMDVWGAGSRGSVKAFLRPPPRPQASYADLRTLVAHHEFCRQQALVIGGSRGLGEVTAKLLAAGGADVHLTFHRGVEDAARVVNEIRGGGGRAVALAWDVASPPADAVSADWRASHLYYFATPHIGASPRGAFSSRRFTRFIDCYVTGFVASVRAAGIDGDLKAILFPSSVLVDELPSDMGEYAAAKAAGEVVCRWLATTYSAVRIRAPRIPRTTTDSSARLLPVRRVAPPALMLEQLRLLNDPTT